MQTDDNDGEQSAPILANGGKGVDEVDDKEAPRSSPDGDSEHINNKINESQKIQTNV